MASLLNHLRALVDTRVSSREDPRVLDEWGRTAITEEEPAKTYDIEDLPLEWDSVLSVFRDSQLVPEATGHPSLLQRLVSKAAYVDLLQPLNVLLNSSRSDEEVSAELMDLIGFEEIELVMEILAQRSEVAVELNGHLNGVGPSTNVAQTDVDMSQSAARQRMEQAFKENASKPLFSGVAEAPAEVLPHVYTSSSIVQGNVLSHFGSKYMLPIGTERKFHEEYEEVIIPPAKPVPSRQTERLIPIGELDELAKSSFPGYTSLNRIQSIVYPTAYKTNENMLICAPTGAGKTDVAMLTILRVLDQHRSPGSSHPKASINRDSFKVIYVAPMKALASEIVRKLGRRLKWLDITVRELTGDMQLTKSEIAATQIIVTTPEKWDVVTRKPTGEGELASSLKLLIIDEVHLLNEERGAVIETIVARTLRQVESSQSIIRIVGLSATLPNYIDVAEFLSVSKQNGLFYFDSSFRPVPLEQHFIGIKGKPGSALSKKNLDRVTFDKVLDLVQQGHQVMVFVHARKETVKSAMALKESATMEGTLDDFSCQDHPQFASSRRNIAESRNKEMKLLFNDGFGIHHAGMLRSDRNMMERMFQERVIKVLCCTATLAWGVNLPAHAVIIKGTQVYDSSKGSFVDLSVLDVLQVFGRAGRPGLETSGEGYICTTEDKLTHYLDAVTSQNPIESQFKSGMIDSLNAEIALGTVSTVPDAVRWLGYTYLFVRMQRNPYIYGIDRDAHEDDPHLGGKRRELIKLAARKLAEARMIVFNTETDALTVTDLGRIAAKYYIRHASIEIFNEKFKPKMTEADVLRMLSMSTEFEQIQVRESELKELEQIMKVVPCEVLTKNGPKNSPDTAITSADKVNILLQGHISHFVVEDFALVSDTGYVAQNGGRIVRALLEIAISQKWASVSVVLMGISKAIEKRMWPYIHPLRQFGLKNDVLYALERWADDLAVSELASLSPAELGELVHLNEHHGRAISNAAKQFPAARINYELRPLGPDVLRIAIHLEPAFNWSTKIHGSAEPFWIWVEDVEGLTILQHSHLVFRQNTQTIHLDVVISIPSAEATQSVTIRFVSDTWMGAEEEVVVPLEQLKMPMFSDSHTPKLDLPFLSLSSVNDVMLEGLFRNHIPNLNAIQTQIFWSLFGTNLHSLVGAPSGSGNTSMIQLLVCSTVLQTPDKVALVVCPKKGAATEMALTLKSICRALDISIEQPFVQNILQPGKRCIRIVTAQHLMSAFHHRTNTAPIQGLSLVACDNFEQLDSEYELAISLLRLATQTSPTRFVGFTASLNDPADLADWLDVHPAALHSFRPRDRDQSLSIHTQTFSIPHSASLFKAMAKPTNMACQSAANSESSIVFVPSRGQCRAIAMDLITQTTLVDVTARGYHSHDFADGDLEFRLSRLQLQDATLIDFISRGIGFFHEGIPRTDRMLMLELFAEGIIRVLIVPRDSCWSLPVRAAVVVIMGTQYVHVEADGSERQLRDYTLTELVRMQSRAVRHNGEGRFYLFCQSEAKDTFLRFLEDGLPLESSLPGNKTLERWYFSRRELGQLSTKDEAVQALGFTFMARRLCTNPAYYDFPTDSPSQSLSRIIDGMEDAWTRTRSVSEGTDPINTFSSTSIVTSA